MEKSLFEYVIDYFNEELEACNGKLEKFDDPYELQRLLGDAIDAYNGGAR